MNIRDKKLENSRVELEIELPAERVEIEYKSVFDGIQKNAKVDGFRKGKAPIQMVERKYMEYADQEVAENLMKSAIVDAITEKTLNPISEPAYSFDSVRRGDPFSFKAVIEVYPTIELATYKEIHADEKVCNVTDEDIKDEIDSIRERYATVTKKDENGIIENGNLAKIKVKRVDEAQEDDNFKDYSIIVGKTKDDSALDKKIVGMKAGEEKEVEVKYPKDYHIKELAGEKVKYLVKIEEVSTMELPPLDDDLAKKANYESVDDMKTKTSEYIHNFVSTKTRGESKSQIIESIVKNCTFDIPESMVYAEMSAIYKKTKDRIAYQMGIPAQNLSDYPMDDFAEIMGMNPEDFRAKIKTEAEASVKTTLMLAEVVRKENLAVSEERFKEFVEKFAKGYGMAAEQVEEMIQKNNSRENIENELILEVAMDFLYDNAKIKKLKPISLQDLVRQQ